MSIGMSFSLTHLLTGTAVTKRAAMVSGRKGLPAVNLANVKCSRLYPVDAEVRARVTTNAGQTVFGIFTEPADIVEGDVVEVDSKTYPVRLVERWPLTDTKFMYLLMEEVRT